MTHDVPEPSHDLSESREDGARGRGLLTWLVAAAAVAVIAGAAVFVLTNRDAGTRGEEQATEAEASVTELQAPDAVPGRCMLPTAAVLARSPIAFDGTVEERSDGLVTLVATHWYAGEPTDLVTIEAPPEALSNVLVSVELEEDERYLVAATRDRDVVVCGFSGPHTDRLAALYAQAFGD